MEVGERERPAGERAWGGQEVPEEPRASGGGGRPREGDPTASAEASLDQTGFLLQRLQDLKRWQKDQELRLLRDQQRQMDELQRAGGAGTGSIGGETPEDDATIDQDVSSLTSFEELPQSSDNPYSSTFEETGGERDDDDPFQGRLAAAGVPSWASRATDSDPSQDPKTVLSRKATVVADKTNVVSDGDLEERPVGNAKSFEEMLAEQLGCEAENLRESPAFQRTAAATEEGFFTDKPKRTFLKKRAGLVRYGGSPAVATRGMSRSKSQSNVSRDAAVPSSRRLKGSTSCSKLDIAERETIAFASKKTPPKRSMSIKSVSSTASSSAASTRSGGRVQEATPPVAPRKINGAAVSGGKNPGNFSGAKIGTSSKSGVGDKAVASRLMNGPKKTAEDRVKAATKRGETPIYDSVEWSFREKLKKADQNYKLELQDLAAFEMLEEAACDSSFCSSSSKVKDITGEEPTGLPSPIPKVAKRVHHSAASTPLQKNSSPHSDHDPSIGQSLVNDIQQFLQSRGAIITQNSEDDEDSTSECEGTLTDDDTLKEDRPKLTSLGKGGLRGMDDTEFDQNGDEGEEEDARHRLRRNRVRFVNGVKGEQEEDIDAMRDESGVDLGVEGGGEMDFSPPRIPRNSPSYLIWSIFTKEREEKQRAAAAAATTRGGKSAGGAGGRGDRMATSSSGGVGHRSPLSDMPLRASSSSGELDFESTLLNAKLAELEREVQKFRKENSALQSDKRRLHAVRKKLAQDAEAMEAARKEERKQAEEERRRIKRDRMLLEKAQKERSRADDRKVLDEVETLREKLDKLQDEMQRKESKWTASLTKLQDQVKYLEKENQHLHEENHRLKMRSVSSKISTNVPSLRQGGGPTVNGGMGQVIDLKEPPSTSVPTLDHDGDATPVPNGVGGGVVELATPRLAFSPAESLDSNVTLVSGATNSTTAALGPGGERSQQEEEGNSVSPTSRTTAVALGYPRLAKGVTEKTYEDGSVEAAYDNGNRKVMAADRKSVKVYYYNGDVKENVPSGLVKYFYAQTKTWHLTYPTRKEVLQFANGQEEVRYPDGSLQISFPDGSLKRIATDGSEEMTFADGTRVEVDTGGDRTLFLANGEKEVHTPEFKRREYPDGTVKILFNDGRQETRYANGRVRAKDKDGNLVRDSIDE